MRNLYYSEDIKKIDEISQKSFHQPGIILMEQAGLKAWLYMKKNIKKDDKIVVVCGGGNNGGDALVMARCAFNDGFKNIKVILCSNRFSESFSIQKEIIESYEIPIYDFKLQFSEIKEILNSATVIIDGIVGIGLKSKLRENLIDLVTLINNTKAIKYSVDVPSGLCDNVNGPSIKADYTFSMGPLKILYYHFNNISKCNEIEEINPSFPPQVINLIKPIAQLDDEKKVNISPLKKDAYKKTRGHLAVFGGCSKYSGALRLTSKSAFSSRCGLVTAYCDKEIYNIVATESPSIIVNKIEPSIDLSSYNAILAGPGWGENREDLLLKILSFNKPMVIDADGIKCFASLYKKNKSNIINDNQLVFTPHLGELKVLANAVLEDYSIDNTKDLIDSLKRLSFKLKATIVCKASVIYIVSPDKLPLILYNLNPSLAVAGSGDVLSGCIAALLAYGLSAHESSHEGVKLHINAGYEANKELGYFDSEKLITYIGKQLL